MRARFVSWDDVANFVQNPYFRGLRPANLRWMWTTTLLGHYTPLAWMSLGLNYVLSGLEPASYHAGNVLLHAANTALVYLLARRLIASDGTLEPESVRDSIAALVTALFFGVHPL